MIRTFLIGAALGFSAGFACSQTVVPAEESQAQHEAHLDEQSLLDDLATPDFSRLSFLIAFFPSELIGNSLELKSYVRGKRFTHIREQYGDLRAVDALYIRAFRITRGNTGLALLYCTLATMDHDIVGIRIPVLRLFLPLTSESMEDFSRRVENLPRRIYSDSPGGTGDRDKLQHFFGSAFITNIFESRGAAERAGNFVEWGEDAFIVQGVYDERDVRANRQGREFGLSLLSRDPLPSHFLRVHPVASRPGRGESHARYICGAW